MSYIRILKKMSWWDGGSTRLQVRLYNIICVVMLSVSLRAFNNNNKIVQLSSRASRRSQKNCDRPQIIYERNILYRTLKCYYVHAAHDIRVYGRVFVVIKHIICGDDTWSRRRRRRSADGRSVVKRFLVFCFCFRFIYTVAVVVSSVVFCI